MTKTGLGEVMDNDLGFALGETLVVLSYMYDF
jgi:hypothetical protein